MLVTADFETHLIKPGMITPRPVCLAIQRDDARLLFVGDDMRVELSNVLTEHHVLGQNVQFDLGVATVRWPELLPKIFKAYADGRVLDTKIRQRLIDIARGEHEFRLRGGDLKSSSLDLKTLSEYWLCEHLEKADTWRLRYGELDAIPLSEWPEDARTYPLKDIEVTRRVFYAQQENRVKEFGSYMPDEVRQLESAWALHLVSAWGMRTDKQSVFNLRTSLEGVVGKARDKLRKSGIINPVGSPSEKNMEVLRDRLLRAYKKIGKLVPVTDASDRFPDGQIKTSAEVLLASEDEDLVLLGEVSEQVTLLDNFIPTLEKGIDYPICAEYTLLRTGRAGCRRPNLQNPPKFGGVRECFIARPGFVFVGCDYDTIELRALAQVCLDLFKGKSVLADILRNGLDPHTDFAANLLGISYEQALKGIKAGDNKVIAQRQLAKIALFGYPGGLSAKSFVEYAGNYEKVIDLKTSNELRSGWLKKFPEMNDYFSLISNTCKNGGSNLVTHKSGRLQGDCSYTESCNTRFQGLTADGAKEALRALVRECYLGPGELYGCRVVLFMHDEFILEVPDDRDFAHRAALRLSAIMRESMSKWIPDVPITCASVMMRKWFKGAKPVFDRGVLRPSKPVKHNDNTEWVHDQG